MSTDHDESTELLEELSVKSDAEKSGSPPPKKHQGGTAGDHAKTRKKRRRGKKRKQRKASGGAAESENQEDSETHPDTEANRDSNTWDSDEELECEINAYNDVIIRPVNVPKAPENSTQYIIDDHNLCHLYMSFETPNPYRSTDPTDSSDKGPIVTEPSGTDAAYEDIDFEYDPPQDFDNSAYYDREFEMSYKSNRFDELLRLTRTELISGLRILEANLKDLSDDLVKENPSPILEKLQADLLELQEKHNVLKDTNSSLTALVAKNEVGSDGSVPVEGTQRHLTLVNNVNFDKTTVKCRSPVTEMDADFELVSKFERAASEYSSDAEAVSEDFQGPFATCKVELPKPKLLLRYDRELNLCSKHGESSSGVGLSPRLGEVESSLRLRKAELSPRLGGVESCPTLGVAESSPRIGGIESSPGLGKVPSSPRLTEVKSSERSILRECRDDHGCDNPPLSEEHELSAPVLV